MAIGDAIGFRNEMRDAINGTDESLQRYLIAQGVLDDVAQPDARKVDETDEDSDGSTSGNE